MSVETTSQAVEPTRVYSPGESYDNQEEYQETYNTREIPVPPEDEPEQTLNDAPHGGKFSKAPPERNRIVSVPSGIPRVFGNRSIVFNAWIASMIIIGFDEWHNLHIFPRPKRLWYASEFYGLLAIVGFVDLLVPIVNAFAIGYTLMLLWQYYNGGITPSTSTPPTTTANTTPANQTGSLTPGGAITSGTVLS